MTDSDDAHLRKLAPHEKRNHQNCYSFVLICATKCTSKVVLNCTKVVSFVCARLVLICAVEMNVKGALCI